jgi:hypothetical protein
MVPTWNCQVGDQMINYANIWLLFEWHWLFKRYRILVKVINKVLQPINTYKKKRNYIYLLTFILEHNLYD